MKFYHILLYVAVFTKWMDCLQLSSSKSDWFKAEKKCPETTNKFAGSSVFLDDTGLYRPNRIAKYNISFVNGSEPVWVYAYRQSSIWISHTGCSFLSVQHEENLKKFYLDNNGPGECYFTCKDVKNIIRIALHNNTCYCISESSDSSLLKSNTLSLASCNYMCPGENLYYCGGKSDIEYKVYLSVYKTLYKFTNGSDEGQTCSTNKKSKRIADCGEKHSCLCGDRDNTNTTELTSVTWDECNINCSALGKKVVVIDILTSHLIKDNVTYWNGYFRYIKDVWNTGLEPSEKKDIKCLALNHNDDGNFTFLGLDCNKQLLALCQKESTDDTLTTDLSTLDLSFEMTSSDSHMTPSTDSMLSSTSNMTGNGEQQYSDKKLNFPETAFLAGLIAGCIGLVTVVITIGVFIYKKRKRSIEETLSVKYKEQKMPINGEVYSEAVLVEDSKTKIDGIEQIAIEETDYDHLHANRLDTFPEETGNLYDHTGTKTEDAYDLTHIKSELSHDQNNINDYDTFQGNKDSEYDSIKNDTKNKTIDKSEYEL